MAEQVNKSPAVQFYPKKWRGTKWVKYDPLLISFKLSLPQIPGCYVIYADGEPIYVGQGSNIRKRLSFHRFEIGYGGDPFVQLDRMEHFWAKSIHVKVRYSTRLGDWAAREIRLIAKLNPRLNCALGGRRKRAA